jgi:hypothetical protein
MKAVFVILFLIFTAIHCGAQNINRVYFDEFAWELFTPPAYTPNFKDSVKKYTRMGDFCMITGDSLLSFYAYHKGYFYQFKLDSIAAAQRRKRLRRQLNRKFNYLLP